MESNKNQPVILSGTQLNAEMSAILNEITLDTPLDDESHEHGWLVSPTLAERLANVADNYEFPSRPLTKSIIRINPKRLAADVRSLSPEFEDGELVGYLLNDTIMIRILCLARAVSRESFSIGDMPGLSEEPTQSPVDDSTPTP